MEILVYNAAGALVLSQTSRAEIGGNEIPIHLDAPVGIYLLTMKVDGVSVYRNKRLVVQE